MQVCMNLMLSRTPKTVFVASRPSLQHISKQKYDLQHLLFYYGSPARLSTPQSQLIFQVPLTLRGFRRGGGAWIPHPHPLKKYHESLGFLSNTVNGVSLAGRWWYMDPCSPPRPGPHQSTKINIVKIGPLFRNFLDPRMRRYRIKITCPDSVCIFVLTATEWKANYFLVWRFWCCVVC